jgi:hypothetical protein
MRSKNILPQRLEISKRVLPLCHQTKRIMENFTHKMGFFCLTTKDNEK